MQPNQQQNQYRAPQPGQQMQPSQQMQSNQQQMYQELAQRGMMQHYHQAQRHQQQQQQQQVQHQDQTPQMVAMQQAYMNQKFNHNQQQHELNQRLMQVEKQQLNSMAMAQQHQNYEENLRLQYAQQQQQHQTIDENLRLQLAAMQMKSTPDLQKAYAQALQQRQIPHVYNNSNPPPGFSAVNQAELAYSRASSALSAEAPEFVPGGVPTTAPYKNTSDVAGQGNEMISLLPIQPEYSNHPVLIQVDKVVVQLSSDPNRYEAATRSLTQLLSTQVHHQALMKEIVTLIFEQGVGEVNFRYPGGRLCEHLSKNIHQQYEGLSFKSLLLKSCQEEFDFRFAYQESRSYGRLIGFTFFLADLMVRLLMPSGQPIAKLKEALCMMITMLLDICSNESLKCAAQVLKMSGRFLDMGDNTAFSTVMNQLRDTTVSAIPPTMKTMLISVVELRASNWGADAKSSVEKKPTDQKNPPTNVLGTVYYNTDGVIDHIEEDFAEANGCGDADDTKHLPATADLSAQVHELEGEEEAAFADFLHSLT